MYSQDSFFDLTPLGQMGLAALSVVLFAITVCAAWALLRNRSIWMRVPGALLIFYIFVWISPQIHYQYFHLLFEFLPNQWVIFPPPSPVSLVEYLTFSGPQSLSGHG
ncbi:MAG: hypothetical protein AAF307_12960, partial [Pseudomonadota bacterium]